MQNQIPLSQIKVIAFKEKDEWILETKYNIGKKRGTQSFSEFITEDVQTTGYKIIILTVEYGDKSVTAQKFKTAQEDGFGSFHFKLQRNYCNF